MEVGAKIKILAVTVGILIFILILALIVFRLGGGAAGSPQERLAATSLEKSLYQVGETKRFPAHDFTRDRATSVGAECVKVGKYCYVFVQENLGLPKRTMEAVAAAFDDEIYPAYGDVLTRELSPGLNADYRVTILFLDQTKGYPKNMRGKVVKGFYWQINEVSQFFNPASAESKIIYILVDPRGVDVEDLLETVEHETNHLKNWAVYKNNMGIAFIGVFSLATLFTIYLGLSHLYFKFMAVKE